MLRDEVANTLLQAANRKAVPSNRDSFERPAVRREIHLVERRMSLYRRDHLAQQADYASAFPIPH